MRSYTVHHRSSEARDIMREVDRLVFVKDGFCWPGLFIPAIWLLFRGLWLELIGYLVVSTAAIVGAGLAGIGQDEALLLGALVNLVVGFEGNELRRWALGRRGFRLIGFASGRRRADAEHRFLQSLADGSYRALPIPPAPPRPTVTPRPGTWGRPDTEDDVVGLFPTPEKGR